MSCSARIEACQLFSACRNVMFNLWYQASEAIKLAHGLRFRSQGILAHQWRAGICVPRCSRWMLGKWLQLWMLNQQFAWTYRVSVLCNLVLVCHLCFSAFPEYPGSRKQLKRLCGLWRVQLVESGGLVGITTLFYPVFGWTSQLGYLPKHQWNASKLSM